MKNFRLMRQLSTVFFGLALLTIIAYAVSSTLNEPVVVGDIAYVSGGVGESEAAEFRDLAKDYPLEIVFIQKLGRREELLAEVKLQLQDKQRKVLLDLTADGPYLLASLPPGRYLLTAEYNNVVKQKWVRVSNSQHKTINHKKIVFWWPIADSQESLGS
jgi:hypothetical protein